MQQVENLSDKYEDQVQRLDTAMVNLFKYENLLNNEYLVRKFDQDPLNPAWFLLQYEVVQRENSIKSQYVQNEQNNRKQYHLILTKILNEHNNKLWYFDQQNLIIRPLFPSERKRVQIKLLQNQVLKLKENIQQVLKEEVTYEEAVYQADKNYIRLFVTTSNEAQAQVLFGWLTTRRNEFSVDQMTMMNVDYLEEFHRQIGQKKYEMIQNRKAEYQQQQQLNQQQYENEDRDQYRNKRGRGGKYNKFNNRNEYNNERDNQNYRKYQNNQYVQKTEQQPQLDSYHLVPKHRSPKQQIKQTQMNSQDFPALDELKK